jgi:prolyl-tRNA editing enzyme YbaK/EbsC (Cys-tRNA(Pro) deacylase)
LSLEGVAFRTIHHAATRTSADSARERGEDIDIGAKALVLKVDHTFRLFVVQASLRLDAKKIRSHFGARKSRFASEDELVEMTGLFPGSIPPFGPPVLPLPLYIDPSIFDGSSLAFNAASLTDSILMLTVDYQRIARGEVFLFRQEEPA